MKEVNDMRKNKALKFFVMIFITMTAVVTAYKTRGFFTFGGEWCIPVYFMVIPILKDTLKSMGKEYILITKEVE